jgi:hypothetical protein
VGHAAGFVSSTVLTITLSASDQATAGTFPVVVTNPAPGGGPSNTMNFMVVHWVQLSWMESDATAVGFNLYRGTQTGGPYNTVVNSSVIMASAACTGSGTITCNFVDSGNLVSGTTYFYVVRAVNSGSVESVNSNEASATIP